MPWQVKATFVVLPLSSLALSALLWWGGVGLLMRCVIVWPISIFGGMRAAKVAFHRWG